MFNLLFYANAQHCRCILVLYKFTSKDFGGLFNAAAVLYIYISFCMHLYIYTSRTVFNIDWTLGKHFLAPPHAFSVSTLTSKKLNKNTHRFIWKNTPIITQDPPSPLLHRTPPHYPHNYTGPPPPSLQRTPILPPSVHRTPSPYYPIITQDPSLILPPSLHTTPSSIPIHHYAGPLPHTTPIML